MAVDNPQNSIETCWKVAEGTLHDTIIFYSSTTDPSPSPSPSPRTSHPLLLVRNDLLDLIPCEIKIVFSQEHIIRKVYILSSARVCEVYHTPDSRSPNQYLCTVRGSPVVKNSVSGELDGNGEEDRESMGSISKKLSCNSSNSEDEWIEVKRVANEPGSSQSILNTYTGTSAQACFEAAIELDDGVSCVSLALRLLSLHQREYAVVTEVHICADPVPATVFRPDNTRFLNSASSSPMAMLLPTLLNLSRAASPAPKVSDNLPGFTRAPPEADSIASRINRLEVILLQLEQRILEPISRIENRLEHFEKQLNLVKEKVQLVDRPCHRCSRFSAPEFTCSEPDPHTPDEGPETTLGSDEPPWLDPHTPEEGPETTHGSDEPPGLDQCPGLRVTAPDFSSCCEAVEVLKPRRVVVGEAMASELAAFLASATTAKPLENPPVSEVGCADISRNWTRL